MKVIFVTTESFIDHSFTMAKELKKKIDLKVIIIAKTKTDEISFFCKELDAVFISRTRFINPLSLFKEISLLNYIKKQRAELVWFNSLSFFQSFLVKVFVKAYLVNVHDVEHHPGEKDYHGIISKKLIFLIHKKRIAVLSKTQQSIFESKYSFKPPLLQLPVIDYYEAAKNQLVSNPGEKEIVKFFFFGSLLPYKGFETLLEAAEIAEKKELKFQINIYGKLNYNADIFTEKISKLKNINLFNAFINYKNVYDLYAQNDIIIIPYKQVTQCGPMLIGYNQNIPLISSDLPGFREYVINGKSGLLFDNTPQGLADKMEEIIISPRKINEMSESIKTEIKNRFSMQSLADSYISVFQKAIQSP